MLVGGYLFIEEKKALVLLVIFLYFGLGLGVHMDFYELGYLLSVVFGGLEVESLYQIFLNFIGLIFQLGIISAFLDPLLPVFPNELLNFLRQIY